MAKTDVKYPGQEEVEQMCAQAERVKQFCDLIGLEFRGFRPLMGLLQGALKTEVSLDRMQEDPDTRPYIWDLED